MHPDQLREQIADIAPPSFDTTNDQAQKDEVNDYLAEIDEKRRPGLGLRSHPAGSPIERGVTAFLPEAGEQDLFGEEGLKTLDAAIAQLELRVDAERQAMVAKVEDGEKALAEMKRAAYALARILNHDTVITASELPKAA